ncbi:phenylalanyl-tRNA synthetase subunit beta [Fructilactobacillus lindneri DSM 20690 = JCM 11027]|uniref:Phenylalanine--tRNA ligase beta subunit n=1 Tax=Fructilactobacillus lindneri DSM 20690 = JCM 11027 TaxID=1122148 RepID=A0A0R2JPL7_9LACO|nr:phenylalanyl-tRNA synthetase subunit beta [Fructilactobacillus lindneri DSM 20690 = JCM 11027]
MSYDWLSDYLKINLSPEDLGEKIERTSVEVDSVFKRSDGLKKLVVGKILSIEKHPDAGHLNICQVDVGNDEPQQIVCGAPNVEVGKKVIVALPGARVGGNIKIKKAKMRGVQSNGMLCALDEIGFPKEIVPDEWKDGIYFLPDDAKVGDEIYSYLGMNDSLIDLDVTPNRGDMLSLRGAVYDLGAVLDQKVDFDETSEPSKGDEFSADSIKAEANESLAPIYQLKVVKNVDVKPSPLWLQIKLWNLGIKPINNVVDITNFVMMKLGQPLHAYDLDQITDHHLEVRKAKQGEKITTLDNQEHELDDVDVVIADAKKPVALAGLMGGLQSSVTAKTKNIVIEAGVFDPVLTRKMAQKELLHTDASQRFERGVDKGNVENALNYAAGMIQKNTNGIASKDVVTGSMETVNPVKIAITVTKINHVLGTSLSEADVISIFKRLGFGIEKQTDKLLVTIPTRCWDIKIDADLYEEVARIYGYDNILSTLPITTTTEGGLTPKQKLIKKSRQTLQGMGLNHAISYSLTNADKAKMFMINPSEETILQWPMTNDHSVLRMNLISGLLDDIAYNQARGVVDVPFYEQGRVFFRNSNDSRPIEVEHIAGAISGSLFSSTWNKKSEQVDFFEIKGIVAKYLETLSLKDQISFVPNDKIKEMHPGRTALIKLGDEIVGFVGQVHPTIASQFKIKQTYVFELDLDKLINADKTEQQYQIVSSYPSIKRDIAMLIDQQVTNEQIYAIIKRRGGAFLKDITLFDVYEGEHVPNGKKSLAYSLTFENSNETLKDDVVNNAVKKIEKYLQEELKVEIR